MLVLALDTSSAAVTVALVEVPEQGVASTVQARSTITARGHGELLAPLIGECLAAAGLPPAAVGAVVAGTGPGPFTGLRVGLVTAAAFADALAVPAYGVCSLDGMAYASDDALLVAADARRKELYWATYLHGVRTNGPDVAKPADVPSADCVVMTGAGARQYAEVLGLPLLDVDHPDPVRLVDRALDRIREHAAGELLIPLYLRRPDAVPPAAPKAVSQ
ncbi:tRNA (adenosine(37)-N6)-threonylcarbamoyltransferase complex dimerization subunit type 1 TsaB [Jatrophihabitans sp.]|uniref:tRNA (adenosine(37)-N6)-threonylcarbamoyltransferase complex dimerization subunit type 1 TsaB n=1 Tax=Jatrophihabitans sp. TaxID=1932789 RepID=UPI0030C6C2FA|nr:hypothetical protein [Jatrophihabitans sp.]